MVDPARSAQQRKEDTLTRLRDDKDLWVGTADRGGNPTLVPLSFIWDQQGILVATHARNPTARNIVETGLARVALGHTRDVVLIDTVARLLPTEELTDSWAEAYAAKCNWDPRNSPGYRFYHLALRWIEVWREDNEHPDRFLMRDGSWLV